jgi:hypothetical protein
MLVIYWEPEISDNSWYVTGHDRKHFREICQQIDAMCEGWV